MGIVVYAYQIIPGDDEDLHFATTLEACMKDASDLLKDLRNDPEVSPTEFGARAVYECTLKMPDPATLVAFLNEHTEAIENCITDRKLVTFVGN